MKIRINTLKWSLRVLYLIGLIPFTADSLDKTPHFLTVVRCRIAVSFTSICGAIAVIWPIFQVNPYLFVEWGIINGIFVVGVCLSMPRTWNRLQQIIYELQLQCPGYDWKFNQHWRTRLLFIPYFIIFGLDVLVFDMNSNCSIRFIVFIVFILPYQIFIYLGILVTSMLRCYGHLLKRNVKIFLFEEGNLENRVIKLEKNMLNFTSHTKRFVNAVQTPVLLINFGTSLIAVLALYTASLAFIKHGQIHYNNIYEFCVISMYILGIFIICDRRDILQNKVS